MNHSAILSVKNVNLAFGDAPLLKQASLQIHPGDRICLVGRNGSGKSTLLKLLAGRLQADEGRIERSKTAVVAYLPQEVPPGCNETVFNMIAAGSGTNGNALPERGAAGKTGKLTRQVTETESWEVQHRFEKILTTLHLNAHDRFSDLSAGLKRRVLLARALARFPDILLLDEPTNHMDIPSIQLIENLLLKNARTLVFVSHDRTFTGTLATRIVELDRGELRNWDCSYGDFIRRRENLLTAETQQRHNFDRKLEKEEAWIRQGLKARRNRNEGRVRALEKLRALRASRRERIGNVNFRIQSGDSSGKIVFKIRNTGFRYTDSWIVRNFSTTILRGDKIGIIGPNGCGKTTLLGLILGNIKPLQGSVTQGTRIEIAFFDQLREQLDPDKTVQESVGDGNDLISVNGKSRHVIGYLKDFLFSPERSRSPVRTLSGGERNRLLLARLFTRPANVLVLDEPTNDLDTETLELLEQKLIDYPGTLLLVSHDRTFLNNVVTSTLVFEGAGRFGEYAGGYDDWFRQQNKPAQKVRSSGASPKAKKKPIRRSKNNKLGFNEQRELSGLPEKIETMEQEQQALYAEMSDPDFYTRESVVISRAKSRLEVLETDIAHAYQRWENLQTRADAI